MDDSNCKEIFLWLLRLRRRVRVTGASMLPTLVQDDEILVHHLAYRRQLPRIGDIVIARHPVIGDLQIVKRVKEIDQAGHCLLLGDNPDSSRNSPFMVPARLILGRVTSRFAPASREFGS